MPKLPAEDVTVRCDGVIAQADRLPQRLAREDATGAVSCPIEAPLGAGLCHRSYLRAALFIRLGVIYRWVIV